MEKENKTNSNTISEQERKEQIKQKRLANLKPFRPYSELTEQERKEQHEKSVKGGLHRQEQVKKNLSMKDQTLKLLNVALSREQAQKILGDDNKLIEDENLNVQSVLLVRMLQEILENGNTKAIEFIRSTSGQEPRKEIELNADITTASDRALMEKVANRLGTG